VSPELLIGVWAGGVCYHAMLGLSRLPPSLWLPWMLEGALWPWFLLSGPHTKDGR
jgi:hypothetical protein